MSLNNSKAYYLIDNKQKAITYDDYYIIFGNAEIRLKTQ
jgi:hypothetical protein